MRNFANWSLRTRMAVALRLSGWELRYVSAITGLKKQSISTAVRAAGGIPYSCTSGKRAGWREAPRFPQYQRVP